MVTDEGPPGVSYLPEAEVFDLLRKLIDYVLTPDGVQARALAEDAWFYVNTTNRAVSVPLQTPGRGFLSGQEYTEVLEIPPYSAELVKNAK